MGDGRPLLIRRDAERMLSLAVAWFVAVPVFVLLGLSFLWPLLPFGFRECPRDPCPVSTPTVEPAFLAAAVALFLVVLVGGLVLRSVILSRPSVGWRIVALIGGVLVALAVAFDAIIRWRPEAIVASAMWPLAPGLFALVAARRARRSPGPS